MIKNDSPEGSRLPEQANIHTSKYNLTSELINPSANIDISCNVSQGLLVTNFDLELEEPELPWEEGLQDRRG